MKINLIKTAIVALFASMAAHAQTTMITIPANAGFVDTGVMLSSGDNVTIRASGSWSPRSEVCGPDGIYSPENNPYIPLADDMVAELIGKVDNGSLFAVGSYRSFASQNSGELWLGINDGEVEDNSGTLIVTITVNDCNNPPPVPIWNSPSYGDTIYIDCATPVIQLNVTAFNAANVEFYASVINGGLVDLGAGSPGVNSTFSFNWVNPFDGNVTLIAVAKGNGCGEASSAEHIVVVLPSCTTAPSDLVSFWKGESSADDSVGGNNGSAENITYATGEVGRGFNFDGTTSGIEVPASSALDVGQQSGFTIETWINPADLDNLNEWLAGWRDGDSGYGAHIKLSQAPGAGQGAGCICANLMDTDGGGHILCSAPVLLNNAFQHVALTYDQDSGVATIYVNGVVVAQDNLGSFTPETSYPFVLGSAAAGGNWGETGFAGKMDEVSVYKRALSSEEINGIFNAGHAGKYF